jgi:hypothetical protein
MQAANLQDVLYEALAVPAVLDLLAQGLPQHPIYTDVPQDVDGQREAAFPYLSFGPDTTAPFNDKGALGQSSVVQVSIWTRELDYMRNKAIADQVRLALDRVPLAIDGWITTELESVSFSQDPDGKTRRGLMLFRVLALP